jgi:HTH-type transcriptional regulator / antitoxin HigA
MKIKPIHCEKEYEAAMERIDELWGAPVDDSPESEELEILLALTGAYERKHHAVPAPSPQDMYEYHLDRLGVSPDQINRILHSGRRLGRVISELTGLSADQVKDLGDVPLKVFMVE